MAKEKMRKPAKKIPVPNSGTGNPGSYPFGPGKVQANAKNKATTTSKPKMNKGK